MSKDTTGNAGSETWQPIETAPMDGENMLVICEDGTVGTDSLIGKQSVISDTNGNLAFEGRGQQNGEDEGPGWEWWHIAPSRRTHWMPLPDPPDTTEAPE